MLALTENGFNTALYWENPDIKRYVSIVPTSGVTGEGIPDLFSVMLKYSQHFLKEKITLQEKFACTVLEVKKIEGLGTTIDVILINGTLREGDRIVFLGFSGVISTKIRALLTPHPMKEMRVKNEYIHYKEIQAAQGIKICADDLEDAMAGSQLFVYKNNEEL
jgi:translation initiation factor 5B